MFQAVNTDLFNPLVPKAPNSLLITSIYYFLYKLSQ